jgi:CII-binding regulator of phage lambda lysogenization HflD
MPTQEERLTTLEKTLTLLKRSNDTNTQELNRNTTMLLGIVSSQQLDIKEIKISLIDIDERLDTVDQRLNSVDQRLNSVDQRLDSMEKKFDQMLSMLSKLTTRPE